MKNITTFLLIFIVFNAPAQIGVNTTVPSGMLDVSSATNGLLIPRVALTANNVAAPVVNPQGGALAISTMVYNTNPVAGVNGVSTGYHYWDGARWISFTGSNSRDWSLNGNTSTNDPAAPVTYGTSTIAATENFLGTTDANDIVFGTNNIERFRIKQTTGNVGIGVANPLQPFHAFKNSDVNKSTILGEARQVAVNTDYQNIGVMGYGRGGSGTWGYGAGVMGIGDYTNSWHATGVYAGLGTGAGTLPLSTDQALYADGSLLGYSAIFTNGLVGVGNTAPDRAMLQTQGGVGNTVATFNLVANSLGMAMVSDWPGIYFNSYYNGGVRQMSNNSYPGMFNYNPGGQFEFSLSNTANTVAGNLAGGTFSNRFTIHRDLGATLFYTNTTATALNVVSGGHGTNLSFFSLGATVAVPENGKGITSAGEYVGVEGRSNYGFSTSIDRMGGLFYVSGTGVNAVATVGSVVDNVVYKILGFGTVNTLVQDNEGKERIMTAPEAPEALFQDYGIGNLVNGYAKIDIDPVLTKNIRVDETHPMKVFIQLEGDCKGVYVFNKTATSFEVKELQNGNSNVSFSYQIVAFRADEERGGHLSKYSDMRFKPLNRELKVVEKEMNFESQAGKNMTTTEQVVNPSPQVRDMKSSQ
jgi:hypothetical protein